jgi:hypothetical protein
VSDSKKGFQWTVTSYERSGFKFKLKYNSPGFISDGGSDKLKIQFLDADKYLVGEDGLSVPITEVAVGLPQQMSEADNVLVESAARIFYYSLNIIIMMSIIILIFKIGSLTRLLGLLLTL